MLGMTFTSQKGTGTGEIDVVIGTVDRIPVGEGWVLAKGHKGYTVQGHCPLCSALHYQLVNWSSGLPLELVYWLQ